MQSPSCLEPQYPTDFTVPSRGDFCVGNPCLCGNCSGGYSMPNNLVEDIDNLFPSLNDCEKNWALSNPQKSIATKDDKKIVQHLFAVNDSLTFAGGNADSVIANRMKHVIGDIMMSCQHNYL